MTSTVASSNRSLAYSSTPSIPPGVPSVSLPLDEPDRQIELRARGRDRLRCDRKPRQLQRRGAGLARLERQHHLEQRMPRQRPRRVQHLDQPLERQLLVAVGRKVAAPHPADQLAEARLPRGVGAQHQRVDEEPDQIVQRRIGAARDRAADRDVGAGPEPAQQSGQTRLQHHEQARAGLPREARQAAVQFRCDAERHMAAAMARHRGPRPVGRQLDLIRQVLQAPRSRTTAAATARWCRHSHRPAPPAATACSRRTAPAAATVPQQRPGAAPGTAPPGPAPADRATSRRPRCDAARSAEHARHRHVHHSRSRTDAPAAGSRGTDRSPARPRPSAPPQDPLHQPSRSPAAAAPTAAAGSPAAAPRAGPGTGSAGSRAARPDRRALPPAPRGRACL